MIAKNLSIKQRYHYIAKDSEGDSLEFGGKYHKYPRKIFRNTNQVQSPAILIKHALKTEKAVKIMERFNTLTFIVDPRATKPEIKAAVQELYGCKVQKVNTLNLFKGYAKKAYVRFVNDGDAVTIASKAGIL